MDDMGIGTREAAQGLVEFALVVVRLMAVIAGMVDITPLIFNAFTAKQMSARGARAASIYLPDGARTCVGDVVNAVGTPALIGATWSLEEVSPNCTTNPLSTIPTGQMVSVKVRVDYVPLFWGGWVSPCRTQRAFGPSRCKLWIRRDERTHLSSGDTDRVSLSHILATDRMLSYPNSQSAN